MERLWLGEAEGEVMVRSGKLLVIVFGSITNGM